MSIKSDDLNDFIAILHDGIIFYEMAMENTENEELKIIFHELVNLRKEAVSELAEHVKEEGLPVNPSGTLTGQLHEAYTRIKALLLDADQTYLAELATLEGRTVDAFDKVIPHMPSAEARGRMIALHDSFAAARHGLERLVSS